MKPNRDPKAALPVVEAEAEPAEIVGGRWDGTKLEILPAGAPLVHIDSATLDEMAKHPAGEKSRTVILRRVGSRPARYSETSTIAD